MPKKLSTNSKSIEARERKLEKKKEEQLKKEKQIEDNYWRDDDKHANRKLTRKHEKDEKRHEQIEKKKELRKMYEEEFGSEKPAKGTAKGNPQTSKLTLAQISAAQTKFEAQLVESNQNRDIEDIEPLTMNPNTIEVDGLEARTVEDAINILKLNNDDVGDIHPERRMKAAFAAYEEQMMPQLHAENPGMRYSQLKNLLFKMFQTAPENPKNQAKA